MVDILVICRKCGKKAPAHEFAVNPELKMAVCRGCQKSSNPLKSSFNPSVKNVPPKSWKTNVNIKETSFRKSSVDSSKTKEDSSTDKAKEVRICKKCKYKYKYDSVNNRPNKCPYCMTPSKSVFD